VSAGYRTVPSWLQYGCSTSELPRISDLLITSLLARFLACPSASGNCAYVDGFR